jgi:large subunit ribosomal protein L18
MKDKSRIKLAHLKRRHRRVRKKINGSADRPRLVVHRSLKHVRAQIVNDELGKTLVQVSSTSKALPAGEGEGSAKMKRSLAVGAEVAKQALEKGIREVSFDRGGRLFHGRVKAVAEAAQKGGLEF